ncbi:hypothetical protein G7Y89_g14636 [Cudoniella acicularis]|uniref:Heterokaryon incompatibility domain-containing protein n=1 Tax=Cudoniella acicularis TaxID=354080 RepID=A0A8H4R0U8_9HELO|nr:hypothetical protein G7Y89_g14636 [Cudoniella acicularis]
MPPYRYSSLSHKPNIIRLLRLLPSKDEPENLRCELLEHTLRESDTACHPYEALSYVWGSEKKPKSITIIDDQKDDQELAVTQNLYIALLHLRDHEIPRIIWADAVCINQANKEEKEHQIKFMAAIYAKASRVIVWLGEARDESDRALESIRIAGEKSVEPSNTELFEQAILQLLERPWFCRIWVLQEMAAARHVIIMCGSTQIDGYAFCLGLEIFKTVLKDSKYLITFLIRGAIFRSRQISMKQGRLSLEICPLGELFDMYHDYNATKRHDKVYALLAMSSDDLSVAGLEPDYNVPWEMLMRSLVKFLLGDHASIDTWNDREIAVIKNKGCTLGQVSSIRTKQDNRRYIQITFNYVLGNPKHGKNRKICWTLPSSAKPVKEGDVICVLQGAQKPTIVRSFGDYFAIIMITAIPSEHIQAGWPDLLQFEERFTRDFLLVWDWEKSTEILPDRGKYDTLIRKSPKIELESQLDKATRTWNFAQILGDSGQHEKAKEKEREAIKRLGTIK